VNTAGIPGGAPAVAGVATGVVDVEVVDGWIGVVRISVCGLGLEKGPCSWFASFAFCVATKAPWI
jgi:hypothetical protein